MNDGRESDEGGRDIGGLDLPEGWREIPTGLPGARLYAVVPHQGGETHWQAEMTLNGAMQRRRCASELYARWWLAALHEPHFASGTIDSEELNEPLHAGRFTSRPW